MYVCVGVALEMESKGTAGRSRSAKSGTEKVRPRIPPPARSHLALSTKKDGAPPRWACVLCVLCIVDCGLCTLQAFLLFLVKEVAFLLFFNLKIFLTRTDSPANAYGPVIAKPPTLAASWYHTRSVASNLRVRMGVSEWSE